MLDKDEVNRLFMIYNHKGFSGILEEFQQKDKVIEILKEALDKIVNTDEYLASDIAQIAIKQIEDLTQKENKE